MAVYTGKMQAWLDIALIGPLQPNISITVRPEHWAYGDTQLRNIQQRLEFTINIMVPRILRYQVLVFMGYLVTTLISGLRWKWIRIPVTCAG